MIFKNKVCEDCNRKTKQQFIGLCHCKCGASYIKQGKLWTKFQRTSDMVFKLDKFKKPVIDYK